MKLKDVRNIAEEKVRQRLSSAGPRRSAGQNSGFASERARAKQAVVDELGTYDGRNVHKIAAQDVAADTERILNVCAYCRVSTDDIEQAVSIELQKTENKRKIRENPKWRYVGTYVDDGFSGTNTEHRPAFNLMMRDAMAGKIDLIITKSVSRFARNLLDCIGWVRRLKTHEPPIAVFFEQENLNTMDSTSNIILFVLAMVAEEESHMKSEAMLLSLEWRLSRGRFLTPALLGYDKVEVEENGVRRKKLVINESQAQSVRLMYYMLLSGSTTAEIAATLTELKRETGKRLKDGTMNTHWTTSGVIAIMRNERYCGDVLARKTWTPDFHDHKAKKNRGKKNKYYQPAHHDAIVTRAQWNAAQRILNSHRYSHSGCYLPMQVIDKGALCGYISINRSWAGYDTDEYFRVSNIVMGLEEGELTADLENEHLPDGGHKIAGLTDEGGIQRIARELSAVEQAVKAQLDGTELPQEEPDEMPRIKPGFQVACGSMFSHVYEPVVRFTRNSIAFNSTCVSKMNVIREGSDGLNMIRCRYVEVLFNPVERMLAVRPCPKDHPNAICWADENGKGSDCGATAFCKTLYEVMDWDLDYGYRVPAILRSKNGETVLFFDLDNFIGKIMGTKADRTDDSAAEAETVNPSDEAEPEDTRGIFFAADDEPQEVTDVEAIERKLQEMRKIEKRNFGTPVFEHDGNIRLPAIDDEGEWDVMATAVPVDSDHRVEDTIVQSLHNSLRGEQP